VNNPEEEPFAITSDIKTQLSHLFKKEGINLAADDFEVKVINNAPFAF
jgi:hypothetical protein